MVKYRYSIRESYPEILPITLDEAKVYLRVDNENDDSLISGLISSAGMICEKLAGISLISRSVSLFMDSWEEDSVVLPSAPVSSVTAIKVYDDNNGSAVYPASNYVVDTKNQMSARIVLKTGSALPSPGIDVNGIEIQYSAGFGTASSEIPALLKQGILQLVAYMYQNRGDDFSNALKNSGANAIFAAYRRVSVI